jgi:CelD/BcsL family acetyltransferase involved in cellulose biosynthesis
LAARDWLGSKLGSERVNAASTKLEFAIFDATPDSRQRIREDWATVVAGLDNPAYYHYPEWYETYVDALEPNPESIKFVVAYRRAQPIAIFPLRLVRRRFAGIPVRALEVPQSPHTLLGDFVFRICAANATVVRQLLAFLGRQRGLRWDVLQISNALEGAAALFSVRSAPPRRAIEDEEAGCHYLLCSDFRASPKLNNKRNRLARVGEIEYVHVRAAESIAAAVDDFMDVEASGWKASEGTAIRCRPREVAFYHRLAARFAMTGSAQVSLLKVGGKTIAGAYMLRTGRTLYWLKHGFDEEFAKSSPGQLLFTELIRDCLATGHVDRVNFITNNEWHKVFAPQELPKRTTLVFRGNLFGWASYVGLRSKTFLARTGIKALFQLWRGDTPVAPAASPAPDHTDAAVPSMSLPKHSERVPNAV